MVLRFIPNFLTLCNLMCGCVGIVAIAQGEVSRAAYLIWAAAAFDFADGLAARALKAYSPIGGDLDSLADMVSFGVLPGYMVFSLINQAADVGVPGLAYAGFSVAVFSALRLAIFNVDTRQKDHFIGLPVPASALLISALPLGDLPVFQTLVSQSWVLLLVAALVSYLMVSPFPLLAFKFDGLRWQGNEAKLIFMLLAVVLFAVLQVVAIPIIILAYIGLSLVINRKSIAEGEA